MRVALEALIAASEEDAATGGPDPKRGIYPNVVTVTDQGYREIEDDELGPIAAAALEDAVDFANTKARPMPESGVDRQADDPYVISSIGHMAIATHQAEAMLSRALGYLEPAIAAQLDGTASGQDLDRLLSEASVAVAEAKAVATEASLRVSEMIFSIGGASATLRQYNFDRHWRNARTHTTHDPVSYKYRLVGNFWLNDILPPISTKV